MIKHLQPALALRFVGSKLFWLVWCCQLLMRQQAQILAPGLEASQKAVSSITLLSSLPVIKTKFPL